MKSGKNGKSRLWLLLVAVSVVMMISGFVLSAIHYFSQHEILLGVCYSIAAPGSAWLATWRYLISRKHSDSGTDSRTV